MLESDDYNKTGKLMNNDPRLQQLHAWLNQSGIQYLSLEPASADASFRRYFRIRLNTGETRVVMDAPPAQEDCKPYVAIDQLLESAQVHVPHIYNWNEAQGFMLLSDLGNTPYLSALETAEPDPLYRQAIDAIVEMQTIQTSLPAYDEALLQREIHLFDEWYLGRHLQLSLSQSQQQTLFQVYEELQHNALAQPRCFVHRDYHSRNLMLCPDNNPGVIDFQDAVIGPVSYDLVSLLKDCYIAWPRHQTLTWLDYYLQHTPLSPERDEFIQWFDLMGVQRHLKATGIFARLNHRDGKPAYLNDIPRNLAYIFDTCRRYHQLQAFAELLVSLDIEPEPERMRQIQ